jgi:hypothetical protein
MKISEWEQMILFQLGWQVRAFTTSQLAKAGSLSREQVQRKIRQLREKGLVSSMRLPVAEFNCRRPLVCWPSPNYEKALRAAPYRLAKRWRSLRWQQDEVIWISRQGVRLFGGCGGHLRQRLQLQHDLGTAQVFLQKSRAEQRHWMGEDWFRRSASQFSLLRKVPDAVIRDEGESICKAVEFGGRYSRRTLRGFSKACLRLRLAHEIW